MAKLGIIPNKLEKCDTPTYVACIYDKSTCKPWRGRYIMTPHKPQQVAYPRQIVSVDQVLSPNPGLEAYMTGILSTKIYKYATVFVDHLSRYSYMHFQKTSSAEDTIGGKHAFKRMSASHGIIIKQYHADSGIFRWSGLMEVHVAVYGEVIHKYCGILISFGSADASHLFH